MKNPRFLLFAFLLISVVSMFSCKKTDDPGIGHLTFKFQHKVDGDSMIIHQMKYVNAIGNQYEVTEVEWFLSDITLYRKNDAPVVIAKTGDVIYGIHYVDTKIKSTFSWSPDFEIPEGDYDSISFVFGIDEQKNKSGIFRDFPESAMFWPDIMGGGYHYMKFNGFYKDTNNVRTAFNYHLGIGQIYSTDTTFVQNYFTVTLKNSSFNLGDGKTKEIQIIMNLEEWFTNPIFDFHVWGGQIMDKQDAMAIGCRNGKHVFAIGYIKDVQ